jgi:hypothetical protein
MSEPQKKLPPTIALIKRIQGLMRPGNRALVDPNQAALQEMAKKKSRGSRKHFAEMEWAKGLMMQEIVQTGILALVGLLIWSAVFRLKNRTTGYVALGPSLSQQMAEVAPVSIKYDILMLFLRQTLGTLGQIDDKSMGSAVDSLRGIVHPSIIAATKKTNESKRKSIQEMGVIQDLHIEKIRNVVADEAKGQVRLFVHGFIPVTIERGETGTRLVRVPYVARVVLEKTLPGDLNPFPFYMLEREERIGASALSWTAAK